MIRLPLALVLGVSLCGVAQAASTWTGGDDLPTNPLACDNTPAAAVSKPYDGASVTNAPDANQYLRPSYRAGWEV